MATSKPAQIMMSIALAILASDYTDAQYYRFRYYRSSYYYYYTGYRYYYYYYYYTYYSGSSSDKSVSSSKTIGAIVGVIFSAIFFTALIIGLACFCRIRRQRKQNERIAGQFQMANPMYNNNVGTAQSSNVTVATGGDLKGYNQNNDTGNYNPTEVGVELPSYETAVAESTTSNPITSPTKE